MGDLNVMGKRSVDAENDAQVATLPVKKRKLRKGKKKSKAERLARSVGSSAAASVAPAATADANAGSANPQRETLDALTTLLDDPSSSTSKEWDVAQSMALRMNTVGAREMVVSKVLWTKEAPKAAAHYAKRLQLTHESVVRILLATRSGDGAGDACSSSTDGVSHLLVAKFLVEVNTAMVSNELRLEKFLWPWLVAQAQDKVREERGDAEDASGVKKSVKTSSHAAQAHSAAIRLLLLLPPQQGKGVGGRSTKKTTKLLEDEREELQRLLVEKCLEKGEFLHFVPTFAPAFRSGVDQAIQRAQERREENGDGFVPETDGPVVKTEQMRREKVASRVEGILQLMWPDAKVFTFGSSATGLLRFHGGGDDQRCSDDLDLCVLIPSSPHFRQATAPLVVEMKEHLSLYLPDCQDLLAIEGARIPIVQFTDPVTGLKCDICVNNVAALWNTQLMRRLLNVCNPSWSHRIRSLSLWLKQWRSAKRTLFGSGLSSYGAQLLVFYYLQRRRVLPTFKLTEPLIETSDALQSFDCDAVTKELVCVEEQFGQGQGREGFHRMPSWSVLIDFFKFYGMEFDYENAVVSLRCPDIVSKCSKSWTRKTWKTALSIEDPIETDRDLGTLFNRKTLAKLRTAFVHACVVFSHEQQQSRREQVTKLLECVPYDLPSATPDRKDSF